MIEINTFQNRQGQWTATVTVTQTMRIGEIPKQFSYKVKPHKTHQELMQYLATRIVDGGKVLIKADQGIL